MLALVYKRPPYPLVLLLTQQHTSLIYSLSLSLSLSSSLRLTRRSTVQFLLASPRLPFLTSRPHWKCSFDWHTCGQVVSSHLGENKVIGRIRLHHGSASLTRGAAK